MRVIDYMNKKKSLKLILIIIVSCLLIDIGIGIINSINQNRSIKESKENHKNYKSNIMRFPIKINEGEYRVIDYGNNYLLYSENGFQLFKESSTVQYLNEIDTKYSEYIITEDTSYVCVDIDAVDAYMEYIEYPVPISDNELDIIRSFMGEIDNDIIEVLPFNDGIHCFITGKSEQYILNIESGEVLWNRGSYYESPEFDPIKDTLTCGGDLSSTSYVFNKYGELIKTKEYGITKGLVWLFIVNFMSVISVLFIMQQLVNKSDKSSIIKIITNILLVPVMLFFIVIVLWLSSILI